MRKNEKERERKRKTEKERMRKKERETQTFKMCEHTRKPDMQLWGMGVEFCVFSFSFSFSSFSSFSFCVLKEKCNDPWKEKENNFFVLPLHFKAFFLMYIEVL